MLAGACLGSCASVKSAVCISQSTITVAWNHSTTLKCDWHKVVDVFSSPLVVTLYILLVGTVWGKNLPATALVPTAKLLGCLIKLTVNGWGCYFSCRLCDFLHWGAFVPDGTREQPTKGSRHRRVFPKWIRPRLLLSPEPLNPKTLIGALESREKCWSDLNHSEWLQAKHEQRVCRRGSLWGIHFGCVRSLLLL